MCLPVPHRAFKAGCCHSRGPAYNTWVLYTPTHDPKAAPPSRPPAPAAQRGAMVVLLSVC